MEVLRDGASAQYGSDAIAGVINFILKENNEGGSIQINTGEYSEGDGESVTVNANIGLPLGDDGFLL
jgi:iron complex outermembrane receptor protein